MSKPQWIGAWATVALLSLGVVACDETSGKDNTCSQDTDCAEGERCHPVRNECLTSLCSDTEQNCGGETPACNLDANSELNGFCVCDDTSCPTGAVCNDLTGLCVSSCTKPEDCGEGGVCDANGACVTLCDSPGVMGDGPCLASEICMPDGTCAQPCDSLNECILATDPGQEICDFRPEVNDAANADFNTCGDPDSITGSCTNASAFARDAGGPIIWEISTSSAVASGSCQSSVFAWTLKVYSSDDLNESYSTGGIQRLDASGSSGLVYSDGAVSTYGTHPTWVSTGTAQYDVRFTLCVENPDSQLAVYVVDENGDQSNAICFKR